MILVRIGSHFSLLTSFDDFEKIDFVGFFAPRADPEISEPPGDSRRGRGSPASFRAASEAGSGGFSKDFLLISIENQ